MPAKPPFGITVYPTSFQDWVYFKHSEGERISGLADANLKIESSKAESLDESVDFKIGTYRMKYYCNGMADATVTVLGKFRKSSYSIGPFDGTFNFLNFHASKKKVLEDYELKKLQIVDTGCVMSVKTMMMIGIIFVVFILLTIILIRSARSRPVDKAPHSKIVKNLKNSGKLDSSFQGEYVCEHTCEEYFI